MGGAVPGRSGAASTAEFFRSFCSVSLPLGASTDNKYKQLRRQHKVCRRAKFYFLRNVDADLQILDGLNELSDTKCVSNIMFYGKIGISRNFSIFARITIIDMAKDRITFIDNISGLLIIFMIFLYHLPGECSINQNPFFISLRNIYDFFMAWFFFKSGMFYKERQVLDELKKCWSRLLIPFFSINAICMCALLIFGHHSFVELIKVFIMEESMRFCGALWFLLSLAIVKVSYPLLTHTLKINKWILCFSSFTTAFLLSIYTYKLTEIVGIPIPRWFGNVFLGMFFYALGDLLRERQYDRYIFAIALPIYIIHLFFPCYLDFIWNSSRIFPLSVLYYVSGIILFDNVFKRLFNYKIFLLTYIGKNSMVYYITHYTFFRLLFTLLDRYSINLVGWPLYLVTLVISIFFLTSMDYLFRIKEIRWIIGG